MSPPYGETTDNRGDGIGNEEYANINWDEIGMNLRETDYMYIMKSSSGGQFSGGVLVPYGPIEISPASSVLNYGQGLFEGLKAYRREDGRIMIFRPVENALRMQMGADRMYMPAPSVEQFVEAVRKTILANKRWVPPFGKGTLYVRPLLIGSGPVMGINPAKECTFLVYTFPIGNLYKGREYLNLFVDCKVHRTSSGGTGGIKSITNYSPVFQAVGEAKANGFDDVLFLDAETGNYVEEVACCNIFFLKGKVISTPALEGTVLPGITRKSIIEIARDLGFEVQERRVTIGEALEADEVFCTGTAVTVTRVASITYQGNRVEYNPEEQPVSCKLRSMLAGIQTGLIEDKKSWTLLLN